MARRLLLFAALLFACPSEAFYTAPVAHLHEGFVRTTGSRLRRLPMTVTVLTRENRQLKTALGAAMKFRNFEEMLTAFHDKPVLVTFHATWCGPCRLMKKELAAVRNEVGDGLQMFSVDTEKWPSLGARYHVEGLPTIVIFKGGEILYRFEGVEKAEDLVRRVKTLI